MKIKLSGLHSRKNLVVKLADSQKFSFKKISHVLNEAGAPLPIGYNPREAAAYLPLSQAAAEFTFEIPAAPAELPTPFSVLKIQEGLKVAFKNQDVFEFQHSKAFPKPFFGPVFTPNGEIITRDTYPEGASEIDHPWQRGLFTGHGSINGHECWNEPPGGAYGRCVQTKMFHQISPAWFQLETENDWVSPTQAPLLAESRQIRVFGFKDLWVLDWQSFFQAKYGTVRMGSTKEAGFLAIRLNPQMQGNQTGLITNACGGSTERECWSRHAQWVDYSGKINGKTVGIAMLDHLQNLRHPAAWHVRDYGLFAHNIWLTDPNEFVLESGQTWQMNYRILIHSGDATNADIKNQYLDYENPPIMQIVD
jgi:hypothetical protein